MPIYPSVETFSEAVAEIERRFKCIPFEVTPGRSQAIAPTGEDYIELLNGQIYSGGDYSPAIALSERAAAQLMLDGVLRLGEGKAIIYWRTPPEIDDTYVMYDEASAVLGKPYPFYREYKAYRTYCRLAFA